MGGPISVLRANTALLPLIFSMLILSFGLVIAFLNLIDVIVEALCHSDQCPQALYLSTIKATVSGVSSVVMAPIIGGLSDHYGRKPFLILSFASITVPFLALVVSRSKLAVYVFFILEGLASVAGSQSWMTLIYAYVADVTPESSRAAAFGVVSGSSAFAFLVGPIAARFVPQSYAFPIAATFGLLALLYMTFFLRESLPNHHLLHHRADLEREDLEAAATAAAAAAVAVAAVDGGESTTAGGEKSRAKQQQQQQLGLIHLNPVAPATTSSSSSSSSSSSPLLPLKSPTLPSRSMAKKGPSLMRNISTLRETVAVVSTSRVFTVLLIISFLHSFADIGQTSNIFYVFKAKFHWDKNQFSLFTAGIGMFAIFSQLVLMPFLVSVLPLHSVLLIGLLISSLHMIIYGVATKPWMVYLALSLSSISSIVNPMIGSLVSRYAGPSEQGKLQGVVSGVSSLSAVLSPLVINPITALFLSDRAPFPAPGFGIFISGLVEAAGFLLACCFTLTPSAYLPLASSSQQVSSDENCSQRGQLASRLGGVEEVEGDGRSPLITSTH